MTTLTRSDLSQAFNGNPKLIAAFEELFFNVEAVGNAQALNVASTQELKDATVLTLSPNDSFSNERVVQQGRGISLTDTGTALVIAMLYQIAATQGFKLSFNIGSDMSVTIPTSGTTVMEEFPTLRYLNDYATDAAAAAGGVQVNELYRTGNIVKVRIV